MAGIGFSLVMPFMSLYIDTLGNYSTSQLNFWSGLTFFIYFLGDYADLSLVGKN